MMKKRLWIAVFSVLCAGCFVAGGQFSVAAKQGVVESFAEDDWNSGSESESVTDIVEYMTTTAFSQEKGVSFTGDGAVVFSRDAGALLQKDCGISFATKFAGNGWAKKDDCQFRITLGANELYCTLANRVLRIDAYNRARSTAAAGQYVKAVMLSGFDSTQKHVWKISRVLATDASESEYALRLYIDDNPVLDVVDDKSPYGENASEKMEIVNYTGVNVTVWSALESAVTFEEESNVLDVLDFHGDRALFSWGGVAVADGEEIVSADDVDGFAGASGFKWKMRTSSEWSTNEELLTLTLGATDVAIGYDADLNTVYASTYTKWTDENEAVQTLGSKEVVMKNYDPISWHTWRIVSVKADGADGYAVRFYVDGVQRLETYTSNDFSEDFSDVRFVNRSGDQLLLKSAYYTNPVAETEVCKDIVDLGGNKVMKEDDGLLVESGGNAISVSSETLCGESAGVEFVVKSAEEWDYDGETKLQVMFGTSEINFKAVVDGTIAIGVRNYMHALGDWSYETIETKFDETQWHTIKITRRKFVQQNGENGRNGFVLTLYLDGVKVLEKIEVLSTMWDEAYKTLRITNLAECAVAFQSTKPNTESWETLPY